ncbi:MAG: hypothetical protein NXI31_11405 [bacterium]|nr:hypothetical protein [bacterium]
MTARITVTPNPANAGDDITICYDFSGVSETSVTLSLSWDPPHDPDSVTLTPEDNCVVVTSSPNTEGLIISDNSGNSEDEAVTF